MTLSNFLFIERLLDISRIVCNDIPCFSLVLRKSKLREHIDLNNMIPEKKYIYMSRRKTIKGKHAILSTSKDIIPCA